MAPGVLPRCIRSIKLQAYASLIERIHRGSTPGAIHLGSLAANERAAPVAASDAYGDFLDAGIDKNTDGLIEDTLGQAIIPFEDFPNRSSRFCQTIIFFLLSKHRGGHCQSESDDSHFVLHQFILSRRVAHFTVGTLGAMHSC